MGIQMRYPACFSNQKVQPHLGRAAVLRRAQSTPNMAALSGRGLIGRFGRPNDQTNASPGDFTT
jgi:hypothetical protein